jgi:hypothetical protein
MRSERCRHGQSFLMCGARLEWCYECGAWRRLKPVAGSTNAVAPDSAWCRPVGRGGPNPFDQWDRRTTVYLRRASVR